MNRIMKGKHHRKDLREALQTVTGRETKEKGPIDQYLVGRCEHEGGDPLEI